jgi:tetratricopeptide (TPR) repeat protein
MQTAQYSEAIEAYNQTLQFNPDHPWEHTLKYHMAFALWRIGDYESSKTMVLELLNDRAATSSDRESLVALLKQMDPAF